MSSNVTTADTDTTPGQAASPRDEVVTLVILYAAEGSSDPGHATVRIPVTRARAAEIVNFRHDSPCAIAMTRDLDAAGNPYSLNVGTAAVAVYVES
jgi:hypothetical protein